MGIDFIFKVGLKKIIFQFMIRKFKQSKFKYDLLTARHRLFQRLTKKPNIKDATISDLFIWINNNEFDTQYVFVNLEKLLQVQKKDNCETEYMVVFFNEFGEQIRKVKLNIKEAYERISLGSIINTHGKGTFCIFSKFNPENYGYESECFFTERGYISYVLKGTSKKFHIHGNIDAIASNSAGQIEPLSAISLFKRFFYPQVIVGPNETISCYVTNPTKKKLSISFMVFDNQSIEFYKEDTKIFSLAYKEFTYKNNTDSFLRISIKSRLIMARPIVHVVSKNFHDFFHA